MSAYRTQKFDSKVNRLAHGFRSAFPKASKYVSIAHLARFMVPSDISVLDDMPRTPTGKAEKGILREIACRDTNAKIISS
jgi:acyl-coenzyme A synthetase/AMP-(fatty) acid ligase